VFDEGAAVLRFLLFLLLPTLIRFLSLVYSTPAKGPSLNSDLFVTSL
jgi:hypothetical protein